MGTPKHLLLTELSHVVQVRAEGPRALKKKLDISFQVTRFQMIFGEKEQSVKSVTVVTVVTVFSGGVHAFPLLLICKYYIYTYIFIYI